MAIDPTKNVNKKIPEMPHDGNRKVSSVLILPIVQNNEIIGYLPAKAIDNGDGTALLKVDTELVLDGNVIINNMRVASDDGVNANRFLKIDPATGALIVDVGVGITSGIVKHHNGTANIVVATVTFSGTTRHVQIENFGVGVAKDIFVSFDGGTTFRTIQPGVTLDVDGIMTDLKIKATADGTPYEILAII